jgi:hypothetical protein
LQSDATDAQQARSIDARAIYRELERLVPDSGINWQIELVGPGVTAGEIAVGNAQRNAIFADLRCFQSLGGPMATLAPTPTTGGWSNPQP